MDQDTPADAAGQTPDAASPASPEPVAAPPTADPRDAALHTMRIALTLVSVLCLALIVALVVVLMRWTGQPSGPAEPTAPTTPETTAAPDPLFLTQYVAVNPDAVQPGAIIVEIHDDYQCPWCGRAEEIFGAALGELSQSGDIDLRIHLRSLIGDQVVGNDSSRRAGAAALCADQVGYFWAYHSAVFANQPEEGVGYTDQQLRVDFAAQAGLAGQALDDFLTCYDSGATVARMTDMEQEGVQAGISSTPTFYVDGLPVNFNLQNTGQPAQPISTADLLAGLREVSGG
jgi:protein-disulfide isomerase